MRITAICTLLLLMAGIPMSLAGAQDEPPRSGPFARVGVGLGNATNTRFVGTNDATGVVGSVQAGVGGQRVEFVLAFDWQPFKVESPVAEGDPFGAGEAVQFWYLLGGVQFFLNRNIYLRPSIGYARADWSGPAAAERAQGHVAAGLAFGGEWRVLRRQWIAAELELQGAADIQPDSPISETRLVSLKVMVPFY